MSSGGFDAQELGPATEAMVTAAVTATFAGRDTNVDRPI
jgi:hypothetical protein